MYRTLNIIIFLEPLIELESISPAYKAGASPYML